ncbi:NACHT domain-containing protein [Mucilaginibacter pedocola]|uniref:Mrr-like domain-containing protein n=1 Tax=Mucilaginibacter pedocola TaxID=1792845 RepID=A0A1S9PBC8_9SPHI|nr:hypothetical protein [Mucilaginibacter pedocola]OOQ58286.1 hypothetical protein BC343_11675 [Mucilaginibacter pedocola]
MNKKEFTWEKLDWKDFQRVSLFLYREDHQDPAIEEYLRQGHFQAGIDLLSFQQSTGKYICIQCKHTNLTLAKLKDALSVFLSGDFAAMTETFIISTSADLQKPAVQTWISQQKIALREQKGIAFDVWDRQRLEDRLEWHYLLVEKYFGQAEAIANCFKPAFTAPELLAIQGFITRHIQPFEDQVSEDRWHASDTPRSTQTLAAVLAVPADYKRICLVAEAYEGKSSLFRQTAWDLSRLDLGLVPLILDLKFCSVLPVHQLLDINFGTWREVPAKDLIILIDGLDEVAAEHLDTVAGHIRDFQQEHPAVRLAVSCRTMFYKYQNLATTLKSFEAYELLELHMRQIFDYLEPLLGSREKAMNFYSDMNGLGVADLLGTPFYLVNLAKWFSDLATEMPKNKMAITNRFVDESLQISAGRKLRSGLSLDKHRVKYRIALQQFALLLQIKGWNACSEDDLQQLFEQGETDLLLQSSILNIKGPQWSFINAIFQEQLAALALHKLDVATVISLITLGDKIKKVSRKWIQTLATYLSLLPENDPDREEVVKVIEADNIELLALSEGSKFNNVFRLEVLQKILGRAIRYQARLVIIDEADLAAFAGNDDAVVNELLGILRSDAVMIVKIVACRTLRHIKLSEAQAGRYAAFAIEVLPVLNNADLGRLLLEALAHYKLGDNGFLIRLFENPTLEQSHEFRQGFYQYLAAHQLTDQYYDWLLGGFEPLRQHNVSTIHLGSEKRLLDLLLATRELKHISKLLDVVKGSAFQKMFRDDKDGTKAFYHSLTKVCAEIYRIDPLIIFLVVDYLAHTGRHNFDREPNEMSEFLDLTQTHSLGMQIALLPLYEGHRHNYAYCGAMHPDCFDALFYAVEEGCLDQRGFRDFSNGLYYSGRADDSKRLEELGEKIFGFVDKPDPKANTWQKLEERKRKNDLHLIASQEAFREGVIKLFKIAGGPVIKTNTLHTRFDEDNPRNPLLSSYLTHFISLQAEEKTASLETCLQAVDDEVYFKGWRGERLFTGYLNRYYPGQVQEMLRGYYDEEIVSFPFTEININSEHNAAFLAGLLMKIWAEHQWPTSDQTLLEFSRINTEGYGGMHHRELNRRKSVTDLLLKHFAGREEILKIKILQNLASGVRHYDVLGTQFEICRELEIKEAVPYLLDAIQHQKSYTHHVDDYMALYISLGGGYDRLLPLFEAVTNLNDYLFMFMVKLLEPVYPGQVTARLLECLRAETTEQGRKIEAAKRLAQLGNEEGFLFLINKFEAGKRAPFDVQGKVHYWNVDTSWGLQQLRSLMFLLVDEKTEALRFHDSPKYLLLEILNGFAAKSEPDLSLVTAFMNQCVNDLSITYPANAGHIAWHAEQMMEKYRQINIIPLGNRHIKKILQAIKDC